MGFPSAVGPEGSWGLSRFVVKAVRGSIPGKMKEVPRHHSPSVFYFIYVCVSPACMSVHHLHIRGQKKSSDLLELELQQVVTPSMGTRTQTLVD